MKTLLVMLALLTITLLATSATAQVVYENGPINGTIDAWTFNFGYALGDSFTVSGGQSTITGFDFGAWLIPGDTLTSVQLSINSQPYLQGTTYFNAFVNLTASSCFMNGYGYDVCTEHASFSGPTLDNGTYWVSLQNGIVPSGDPVYWDENDGVGCHSQGCPSQTWILGGTIPSESFTMEGSTNGTTPEPASIALLGSGLFAVAGLLRRKLY